MRIRVLLSYLIVAVALAQGSSIGSGEGPSTGSGRGPSAGSGQSAAAPGLPVTYERLLNASDEPGNWLTYSGDYRSHHYSRLDQINVDNIHRLREKWIYQMHAPAPPATGSEVWTFDRLDSIGGHKTDVLGDPKIVDTPLGKAVEFDGIDDALFIDNHPLAGATTFTWEAIFRPDGGQREQRWFHLNELPATGADSENRLLFEIRVQGDKWFLDSYAQSGSASKALLNRDSLHPLGAWYHVACVYDGKQFRNYVNGVQENAAELQLAPHGPGRASVGVRINKVFFFKGAVRLARFTRRALPPSEFLILPALP